MKWSCSALNLKLSIVYSTEFNIELLKLNSKKYSSVWPCFTYGGVRPPSLQLAVEGFINIMSCHSVYILFSGLMHCTFFVNIICYTYLYI